MLTATVTHYFPWTDSDTFACCGHRMTATDVHSPAPTCDACAARQALEEQAIEDTPLPLDADEARTELSPADALFNWAVDLTRSYAATLTPRVDAALVAHHDGACERDCLYCAEVVTLHRALVRLYTARRPDFDRIEETEARLTDLGSAHEITLAARDADQAVSR